MWIATTCGERLSNLTKQTEKQKQKAEKDFKKAMVTTWSDSDTSNNDENKDHMVNLALTTNEQVVQEGDIEGESR